jgi:hypothetical protein
MWYGRDSWYVILVVVKEATVGGRAIIPLAGAT